MLEDALKTSVDEAKALLADPRNKQALAIAGIAYYLSKSDKERNAVVAGLAALMFLPTPKAQEAVNTLEQKVTDNG